jgi:hypothetical protein
LSAIPNPLDVTLSFTLSVYLPGAAAVIAAFTTMVGRAVFLSSLAIVGSSVYAAPSVSRNHDPCAVIANQTYVPVAQARACVSSFPFNQTLRENVMDVVTKIFNFYTFEDYYYNSPAPFQESTRNIPAGIARINSAKYSVCI